MSRNFAKLKNIETLRKVNLRKKIQDDLNNIKVRVIVIGIILALLFSALPLFNEHGRVSAASFDGDYRVDDTGTGTTIQWIPSIARSSNGDVMWRLIIPVVRMTGISI